MDGWSTCKVCNYTREFLLEMPCCAELFCASCLKSRASCYNCGKFFDIKDCSSVKPMESLMCDVLIKCRHEGCNYESTEFLIQQHEKDCKHNLIFESELITALEPSQTPKNIALQRRKNIFSGFMMYSNVQHIMNCIDNGLSLDETPLKIQGDSEYYTHIILEGDTLAGLSIKYKVSVAEIKDVNHMYSDRIHERTALKIPRKHEPTFSEAEAAGLESLLKQRLINRFRRKTGIKSNSEALYYLENANMDFDNAFTIWAEDSSWEKTAPPFKSCMASSCHEELELFEKPQHKRGCCSLVF